MTQKTVDAAELLQLAVKLKEDIALHTLDDGHEVSDLDPEVWKRVVDQRQALIEHLSACSAGDLKLSNEQRVTLVQHLRDVTGQDGAIESVLRDRMQGLDQEIAALRQSRRSLRLARHAEKSTSTAHYLNRKA